MDETSTDHEGHRHDDRHVARHVRLDIEDHRQAIEAAKDVDAILDVISSCGPLLKAPTLNRLTSIGIARNRDIRSALHLI